MFCSIHVQLVFDHLYKAESIREVGTLKYFRERVNRRNITPDNVAKSFEGTEDFLVSVGKAYLIEAAMEYFGMDDLNDTPTKHAPPAGIFHLSKATKKAYFVDVIGSFVDEFAMADQDRDAVIENQELPQRSIQVAIIDQDHDYFAPSATEVVLHDSTDDEISEDDMSGTDKVRLVKLISTC